MKPSQQLKGALNLISDPEHWCRETFMQVSVNGHFSYCTIGALNVAVGKGAVSIGSLERDAADAYLIAALPPSWRRRDIDGVFSYNDSHTHKSIVALYKRAIALAEANDD